MAEGRHVDYDRIASTYDSRYAANERSGTATALLALARDMAPERVLEVGCGTGRWLAELRAVTPHVYGLDLSMGMLQQAREKRSSPYLVRGRAEWPGFSGATFDLIYCVNAIHHFDRPRAFLSCARRLLRSGGKLAVVGMDPRGQRDKWYIYDYFDGVYDTDLQRFPSWGNVLDWMVAEGFTNVTCRVVERFVDCKIGRAVLDDPFLVKDACSQLALLSDRAYAAGLCRIETALKDAEAAGTTLVFQVDTSLTMLTGQIEGGRQGDRRP